MLPTLKCKGKVNEPEAVDLSTEDVNAIYSVAGGEQDYNNLLAGQLTMLPGEYIEAFDSLVDTGDARHGTACSCRFEVPIRKDQWLRRTDADW